MEHTHHEDENPYTESHHHMFFSNLREEHVNDEKDKVISDTIKQTIVLLLYGVLIVLLYMINPKLIWIFAVYTAITKFEHYINKNKE